MAKQLTAQGIEEIQGIRFKADGEGTLTGIVVAAKINYGALITHEDVAVWAELTEAQRAGAQQFYDKVSGVLSNIYLE